MGICIHITGQIIVNYVPAIYILYMYVLVKTPPQVCMENTARGDVSRDKYSTRQS